MVNQMKKNSIGSQFLYRILAGGTSCLIPEMLYTIVILSISEIFDRMNLKKGQSFTKMIQKHSQYSRDRIIKYIPPRVLSIIIYRSLVEKQCKQNQNQFNNKYGKFLIGGLSGFLSMSFVYPFQRHKILIVSDIIEGQKLRNKGFRASYVAYWRFKRTYKGFLQLGMILFGNRALYYGIYDQFLQRYINKFYESPSLIKRLQFSFISYLFAEILSVYYWYSKNGYLPFEKKRILKNYYNKTNLLNFSIIAFYDTFIPSSQKYRLWQ